MLTIYNCIVNEHDLRLVALAALICGLASFTAISLLHHVRRSSGDMRLVWLGVSATSTGFGIWATHFIAMLAFSPGIPNAYDIAITVASLLAAILITGAGLAIAVASSSRANACLGGAVVGAGIAAMHYTGMAAFEIQGHIVWDSLLVVASIALGGLFGAAALAAGLRGALLKHRALGAVLMTAAICSHHFTAMGAASLVPDPTIQISDMALPTGLFAIAVACASLVVIVLALAGVAIEMRDRRRTELEAERMRGLADAAVEGLVICQGETIVAVNNSFAVLVGRPSEQLAGTSLEVCIPDQMTRHRLFERQNHPIEGDLVHHDGTKAPAEFIHRLIDFDGTVHRAIAIRDLSARRQAEEHIHYLAHYDALTGLPNRSSFNKKLDHEIEAAAQSGQRLAVLCLDLDRFKEVNDLFGHAAGDQTLQSFGKRVSALLDENQMMARLSGDEFAIVLSKLSNPSAAGRLAEAILELKQSGDAVQDGDVPIATSIGIAIFPDDATNRQALLSHADAALYRAKQEGRGTYRFFEASLGAAIRDRRLVEHDLRNAIARNELSLVYQPQKNILTGAVVGFEALLRWTHTTRGGVPPVEFIPIAEDTGIILPLGEWVLRTACQEAVKWTEPLTVAVNVSAVQIHNANFAHVVHEILFETGLTPGRLELEITETALVRDLNRALATLRKIKMLGVRIAMDDFGTGYSSLSNLRAFPFDKIKIDASFIKSVNVNDQAAAIVRSVLGLGRALSLPVLAEGVETMAELKFLESELCNEVQGYLLGRPDKIETFRYLTNGDAETDMPSQVISLPAKTASM
jgi:diguanylate cyclase (GGDEF)-like protein/PAS domain S-box-containing protein